MRTEIRNLIIAISALSFNDKYVVLRSFRAVLCLARIIVFHLILYHGTDVIYSILLVDRTEDFLHILRAVINTLNYDPCLRSSTAGGAVIVISILVFHINPLLPALSL